MLNIRCFGDATLFTATKQVDFNTTDNLEVTIDKMLNTLRKHGGVGIAANQCLAVPAPAPSIIIVGIADDATLAKAQARYPAQLIPKAEVLINPRITERSTETYFPSVGEGCLSLPCSFRGKIARHRWVVVRYQDKQGKTHEENFTELRAHIVQHEVDHLLGVVFMHRLLEDMTPGQRQHTDSLIDKILAEPLPSKDIAPPPTLAIDRDAQGRPLIKDELFKKTLSTLDKPVLIALKKATLAANA